MIWLAAHMWLLLLAAFFIGLGAGWWIWGAAAAKSRPDSEPPSLGTLEDDAPEDRGDL